MSQVPFDLSPYKVGLFRQCPRRYKFRYVDKLYDLYRKSWPHLTLGDNVHQALRRYLSPANHRRDFPTLLRLLKEQWAYTTSSFVDADQSAEFLNTAIEYIRWFYETQDIEARPYMLEALHRAHLSEDLRIVGKIDRIDQNPDGSLHIIDYKTGKSTPALGDFQLLVYAVIVKRKFKFNAEVSTVSYLMLNGDGWQSSEPGPEDLAYTEATLLALKEEISREVEFAPRPSALCHWCDYLEICDIDTTAHWDHGFPSGALF